MRFSRRRGIYYARIVREGAVDTRRGRVDTAKDLIAIVAAFIGVLTGLLTLYGKYLDVKKGASRESEVDSRPSVDGPLVDLVPDDDFPIRDASAFARARQAVKAPAVALMVAGGISLFSNLLIAGFGYVDRYVTPLTTESQARRAALDAANPGGLQVMGGMARPSFESPDDANVPLVIFTMLGLSVASAAAVWAGYDMLKLRGYWFSVAGSVAIMVGGAAFCCVGGLPIGIWSLVILFRPEVSSSFH